MNAFMSSLKRTSEYLLMILMFVASLFTLLFYVGNFGSDFMPVMGNLLAMILKVGLWLSVPVLLAIRKRALAKKALAAVSLYWYVSFLFSLLDDTHRARRFGLLSDLIPADSIS